MCGLLVLTEDRHIRSGKASYLPFVMDLHSTSRLSTHVSVLLTFYVESLNWITMQVSRLEFFVGFTERSVSELDESSVVVRVLKRK